MWFQLYQTEKSFTFLRDSHVFSEVDSWTKSWSPRCHLPLHVVFPVVSIPYQSGALDEPLWLSSITHGQ